MTKRRKLVLLASGFCVLVTIYYAVFMGSLLRSFGAVMSPNGEQSGFDAFIQSVFSFPFFRVDWTFTLPFDLGVLMRMHALEWPVLGIGRDHPCRSHNHALEATAAESGMMTVTDNRTSSASDPPTSRGCASADR